MRVTYTTVVNRIPLAVWNRINSAPLLNRLALQERDRDRSGGHPVADDPRQHLVAAIEWLVRAQDATPDGGVSRGYNLAWNPYSRSRGWQASYPETTGYIIPTFFEAAERLGRPDLRMRAQRMADWEIEIQLPSGAVMGGVIGESKTPTPAVFNTGQVILGLVRAHQETSRDEYLKAACRAAEYIIGTQDADGAFRRGSSQFARSNCTTYNTRTAWALCLLGTYIDEERFVNAGERNVQFGISQQLENGWFKDNCLSDPERPLLHTIAYATRGVLETGLLLAREDFIDAASRTALALASKQRADGGLSGRFSRDWSEQADWDCVTGDSQIAIVWWKLGAATGNGSLQERARMATRFVMHTQNRFSKNPGLAGGIKGSFPVDGAYGTYQILNWATKFFVDALLLTDSTKENQSR